MAGISAYYFIGGAGGFLGSDGLNGKDMEVAVWEADVRSLVVNYLTYAYKPMYKALKGFVPKGPNDPNQARTVLLLFASNLFESCPSYGKVKSECEGIESIDFSSGFNVPKHFYDLLEESKQVDLSGKVNLYFAPIQNVDI